MEITLNIPDYLSVKQWKQFNSLEHLSESEKMVHMISVLSDRTKEEVMEWTPSALKQVYSKVLEAFTDLQPQFYPVFELDGVLYGFTPISKLTLGEYVDLERLASKSHDNLEQIMAILYRPITKEKFNSFKWALEHGINVAKGQVEDIFKYYDIEKYDTEKRFDNAEALKEMPAGFAIGALSFFLQVASLSLKSTQTSSQKNLSKQEMMKMVKEMGLPDIGDGLRLFTTYRKVPSLTLQETSLLQI